MKLAVTYLFLLLAPVFSFGATGVGVMTFERTSWNFGTIKEDGGKASYVFRFTNTGTAPVIVENIDVTCGCTMPEFSREPVMPGKRGEIKISFDPYGRPGPFNKTAVVTANNRTLRVVLSVEGNVTERVRSVEELYPVVLGSGIRLDTRSAYFRYVEQGKARSVVVKYINTSARSVRLEMIPAATLKYLKVNAPGNIPGGGKGDITLTLDLTGRQAWGVFEGYVSIVLNGARQKTAIYTVGYGVDDFGPDPGTEVGARGRLEPFSYDFGDVARGSKGLQTTFTLENRGKQPLMIRNVHAGEGLSAVCDGPVVPGGTATVTVTLDPSGLPKGLFSGSVTMIINDPLRPVREIRLAAFIK